MQSSYLIVKGLLKRKSKDDYVFSTLDEIFEIPKEKKMQTKSKDELVSDFENYIKGV